VGEPDRRVKHVEDLPDESLRCAASGRHLGFYDDEQNPPSMKEAPGWGPLNSWEVLYRCYCGRWKTEVIDMDTGERLSRSVQYGGGVLLWIPEEGAVGGVNQRLAKLVWLRRIRERGGGLPGPRSLPSDAGT
jgi:hypothetical protein